MSEDYVMVERGWLESLCHDAEDGFEDEMAPYELIHALLQEIWMLEEMVVETRKEVNFFSSDGEKVYDGDDFSSDSFSNYHRYFYMPAMDRYIELYGSEAIIQP